MCYTRIIPPVMLKPSENIGAAVSKLMNDYKSFLKFDTTKFKFVLKELML